jgi:hypothetical protein
VQWYVRINIFYISSTQASNFLAETICQYSESLGGVYEHHEAALDQCLDQVTRFPKMRTEITNAIFIFLNLGRYDDCYNFIKWLENICTKSEDGFYYKRAFGSKEGDWIYPTGQDKMEYMDQTISQSCFLVN